MGHKPNAQNTKPSIPDPLESGLQTLTRLLARQAAAEQAARPEEEKDVETKN